MDPRNEEPFDREPWRRLLGTESDAPAQGVDQLILAEARRAHRPRVARWYLPASLAASLVLAVLIVQWQLADSGAPALVTESDVLTTPAPAAAGDEAPAAATDLQLPRQDKLAKPAVETTPPLFEMPILESRRATVAEAPAAVPAAPAPAPARQEPVSAREQSSAAKSTADAAAAPAGAQAESTMATGNFRAKESSDEPRTPEQWYADIEALRSAGRIKEADAELALFKAAHPGWLERRQEQNP